MTKWNDFETDKPKKYKWYLLLLEDKTQHTGQWTRIGTGNGKKDIFFQVGGHFDFDMPKITHWQDLPELP